MRPIDADKLISDIKSNNNMDENNPTWRNKDVVTLLENAPLLPNDPLTLEHLREMGGEPVKVVCCKDCKHLYFKDFSAFCPHKVSACRPDGFCEYGERRKPEERTT